MTILRKIIVKVSLFCLVVTIPMRITESFWSDAFRLHDFEITKLELKAGAYNDENNRYRVTLESQSVEYSRRCVIA